jgi:alpha-N-acetylglucosamine transferase
MLLKIWLKLIPKLISLKIQLFIQKMLNLAWQCVPAFPSDNEKHKNRKIVSKPAWAKQAIPYFKDKQRVKCWRYSSSDRAPA